MANASSLRTRNLERWRSIDPQQPGLCLARILPAMRRGTLEVQTVAGFKEMVFIPIQPDFELATQHVQKLFTLVRVGFTAVAARLDAEQMGFHRGVAPGEKLHADAFCGFQDLA